MEPASELIDDTVGKDKVARKHIRAIEEQKLDERITALESLLAELSSREEEYSSKAGSSATPITPGLAEMKRFTTQTAVKNSTAAVLPPSDVPPTGTVDDFNDESEFVKVRDTSEAGWAMIKRDFVNEFCSQLGATPIWPTDDRS